MLQKQVAISKLRRQSLCDRLDPRGQERLNHRTSRTLPLRRTRLTWSPTKSKLCIEIKLSEEDEVEEVDSSCARSATMYSHEIHLWFLKGMEELASHFRQTIPMTVSEQREFWYVMMLVGAILCLLRVFQNDLNDSPANWHMRLLL